MNEDTLMALGLLDKWLGIKLDDTLIPTLQEMYKDSSLPNSLLFKHITGLLERDGIEVVVVRDSTYADIASVVGNSKPMVLRLNPCRLMESLMAEGMRNHGDKLLRIVTHELIHEITATVVRFGQYVLETPDSHRYREGERSFISRVVELYETSKRYIEETEPDINCLGLFNRPEFVAEALSNPDFQKLLSKIPYQDKEKSVLGELFDSITVFLKDVLGYSVEDNVLRGVLDASDKYFSFLGDHEIFVWNFVP